LTAAGGAAGGSAPGVQIEGLEVPRRTPRLVVCAALALAAGLPALAQVAPSANDLLSPTLDRNPRMPPVFRKASAPPIITTSPAGQLQTFGYQGPIGNGSTGFNSSNARPKASKSSPPDPTAPSIDPIVPSAAKPLAASMAQISLAPVPPSNAIGDARLLQNQNRTRHGTLGAGAAAGSNSNAGASPNASVTASVLTTPPIDPAQDLPRTLVRRPIIDDKRFDPTGIAVGSFRLRPAIEVSAGYDTNPTRATTGGGASDLGIVAPELQVNSNWSRHELTANLRGSYTAYGAQPSQDRPAFDGKIDGRIDVTGKTRVDLETRLVVATDNPGSPNIQAGLVRLPVSADVGGTAGVGQRFNRFDVALKGLIDRTTYQRSAFTDGSFASNDDRNFDQYGTQLRGEYELTPGIKPFVELAADRRHHDLTLDAASFARDSDGRAGKLGSTFELSRILTGQLAFGYLERSYSDPRLPNISGATFDASLTWLATALTTIKLTASTTANEKTLAAVSGEFTHELGLEVDHAFRTWLDLTLKFTGDRDDYVGSAREDNRYLVSTALTYKLTREVQLKSEVRREWLASNTAGNNYQAYVALLGLRLQR
jgi:hypothetical protein